ncbi:hypothetical protein A2U01_0109877, partial [Trifolium medium]|nr:hypothetical protein [Trifolium medium]
ASNVEASEKIAAETKTLENPRSDEALGQPSLNIGNENSDLLPTKAGDSNPESIPTKTVGDSTVVDSLKAT